MSMVEEKERSGSCSTTHVLSAQAVWKQLELSEVHKRQAYTQATRPGEESPQDDTMMMTLMIKSMPCKQWTEFDVRVLAKMSVSRDVEVLIGRAVNSLRHLAQRAHGYASRTNSESTKMRCQNVVGNCGTESKLVFRTYCRTEQRKNVT